MGESAALGARVSRCARYRLRATRSCYVISRTIRTVGKWLIDGETRVVVARVSAGCARAREPSW
jgi:hypothetical protein